jgi:lipopolysaccharide biosynthesis glycosyltransferase
MNRAIAIRKDDNYNEIAELTLPSIKKYVDKCKTDLIFISDCKGYHPHYRILQFWELFDTYDQILSLDIDVLIRSDCPDIFKYSELCSCGDKSPILYSVFEDKGSRELDRHNRIQFIQDKFGPVDWTEDYINTGFSLFLKDSKPIFEPVSEDKLWMDLGYDDVYLMYKIHQLGLQDRVFELPCSFNHMSLFNEWFNPQNSFVLHFAGMGQLFGQKSRIDNIKYALEHWYK